MWVAAGAAAGPRRGLGPWCPTATFPGPSLGAGAAAAMRGQPWRPSSPAAFTSSHQPWEGGQLLSHLHAEKCQVLSLPSRQCDSLSWWCSREVGRSIKNACTVRHRAQLCYPRRKHYGHKTQPIMRSETIKKTVSGLWLPE